MNMSEGFQKQKKNVSRIPANEYERGIPETKKNVSRIPHPYLKKIEKIIVDKKKQISLY